MTDQFGYYSASDGIKRYSKIEAMQYGKTSFHFNDEVFSAIDTTKEPTQTLMELYQARARQIRDKYDYVVLMYSGGSDSGNMLEAFLQAGCKIDEVCTTWDYPTTGEAGSHHNAEIYRVVLPTIKELLGQGVRFNHRLLDITEIAIKSFDKLGYDFEYFVNYYLSINNVAKHFLREHVKEWVDIIDKGKRLVLVWGLEKPVMRYHSDKHWFLFRDAIDNCVGPYSIGKPGWFDELFYWTPDMPSIVIKQAHVVANYCNTVHIAAHYSNRDWWCGYNVQLGKFLTYEAFKSVIYPQTWNPFTFTNGKSLSYICSQRDQFFFEGNVNVRRFYDIVETYFDSLNDNTPKNQRLRVDSLYTREYEIC